MILLIVGIGSIAEKHVAAINKYDINPKIYALRSNKYYKEVSGIKSILSVDEIKDELDFIIISNPTKFHAETILNMLSLNVPLFIEKPVLSDLTSAEQIRDIIKKNNILTYIGCNLRFHPALIFLKNYLEQNTKKINEVNIYCGSYLPNWRPNVDYKESYSSKSEMGGGVHLDLIHEIDYCVWLFGNPINITSFKNKNSNLEISSIDSARYIIDYIDFNAMITLNYYRNDSKREIEILFEDYTLHIDLITNNIINKKLNKVIFNSEYNLQNTYDKQMEYFLTCINQKKAPMNTYNEALEILKLAIYE